MNERNDKRKFSISIPLRVTATGILGRVLAPAAALVGIALFFFVFLEMRLINVDLDVSNTKLVFYDDAGREEEGLRFGVATMLNIEATYKTYNDLAERIAASLGETKSFIIKASYGELRRTLANGDLDVAMVCTGIYTHAYADGRTRLLVRPEYVGDLKYRGLLIVSADSPARTLDDLRGKEAVFTDVESFTGHILPVAELIRRGHNPDEFFSRIRFSGCHDLAIKAVDRRIAEVAAVSSIKWQILKMEDPDMARRLRVVWESEDFGPPPVLAPPTVDDEKMRLLREAFLGIHDDEQAREVMNRLQIKRFVEARESDYQSAQEVYELVKRTPGGLSQ